MTDLTREDVARLRAWISEHRRFSDSRFSDDEARTLAALLALAEAVAGAPEVKVYAGHDGYAEIMLEPHIEAKAQLVGQRVRLLRVEAERGGEG